MPAGLSQMTQSNFSRSSSMTLATPSSVSASLSRVCEAGSRDRLSTPLVADQRLGQLGVALDDVDQVVDDAALGAHHQVEVAQADVEIDDHDVLARLRQRRAERGRRGRLADAALARCDDQDLGHIRHSSFSVQSRRCERHRSSPSSHACTARPRHVRQPCRRRSGRGRRSRCSSASSLRQKMRAPALPAEPGDRPAAQRAVDVDRAAGDHLRAGRDRAEDRHVALRENDRLARAHRVRDDQRAHLRALGRGRHRHRVAFPARRVRGLRRNDRRIDRSAASRPALTSGGRVGPRIAVLAPSRPRMRISRCASSAISAASPSWSKSIAAQSRITGRPRKKPGEREASRRPPRAMPRPAAPARARAPGTNGHGSVGIGGFLRGLSRASFRLTNGYDLAASRLMAG